MMIKLENASCVTLNMTLCWGFNSVVNWYFFLQGDCWVPWSEEFFQLLLCCFSKVKANEGLGSWLALDAQDKSRSVPLHKRWLYYKIWPSQMDHWTWTLTLKSKQMQTLTTHLLTIRGGLTARLDFLVLAFISITAELFCKCKSFGTIVCNY